MIRRNRRSKNVSYLIAPLVLIAAIISVVLFFKLTKEEQYLQSNKPVINNEKDYVVDNSSSNTNSEGDKEDINSQLNNDSNKVENKDYVHDAREIQDRLSQGNYSNDGKKMVFLTFDDGTSTTVTPEILDILDQEGVKATFFLVGSVIESGGDAAKELVKREYKSGHAIGSHSYSHDYSYLYPGRTLNLDNFIADYNKNMQELRSILGQDFNTKIVRCPGGYMSWNGMAPLKEYLNSNGISTIDWNCLDGDAEGKVRNADELVNYTIQTSSGYDVVVVLMHDTYGKEETAKALPRIIKYFKDNGYEFKTLG